MDKRYQVFVSSTYADLAEERQQVLQALMQMDCIPAGMELFPALDEQQWQFIKRIIDDCDYYLLIIGGRYGSVTAEGISYTEKEFDYAVELGLKVVALVHGSPEDIPFGKSEQDPVLRDKLLRFKDKVMTGRLVKFWKRADELPGLVALSLMNTMRLYPAIGWVRANNVAKEEILLEINELRKQNATLRERLTKAEAQQKPAIEGMATLDSTMTIHGTYRIVERGYAPRDYKFEYIITWRELFALISPYLIKNPNDATVKSTISLTLKEMATGNTKGSSISINDQEFQTITIQLAAYGLIQTKYSQTTSGGMALFWSLTENGKRLMMESRVIKQESPNLLET